MSEVNSEYIKKLIIDECGNIVLNNNTKFANLDIDSLSLLSICSDIEDKYKISLISSAKDIQDLDIKNKTFEDFIKHIQNKVNEKTKS